MMTTTKDQVEIAEKRADDLREEIHAFLQKPEGAFVVSAAPGAGKSILLLKLVKQLVSEGHRVAVAAQTNNQADNLVRSWAKPNVGGGAQITRLASKNLECPEDIPQNRWVSSFKDLPQGAGVFVSTAAMWGIHCANDKNEFDFHSLIIDEAFQMTWTGYLTISPLASRVVFIGDEGQLDPVVQVESNIWDTAPFPPHWSAPKTLAKLGKRLGDKYISKSLITSWRIPEESLSSVQPFYDVLGVTLDPVAQAGERNLLLDEVTGSEPELAAGLKAGSNGHPVLIKVPSIDGSNPKGADLHTAQTVAALVKELFVEQAEAQETSFLAKDNFAPVKDRLRLTDVMVLSTRREMLATLESELQSSVKWVQENQPELFASHQLNGGLFIDTPERSQGLERSVVIIVHPLSGVAEPTEFDLSTGRLSVMVSRHRVALFVVSRDGVGEALEENLPSATQALGIDDVSGQGHKQHLRFWNSFTKEQTIELSTQFVEKLG
jgi:hypothetical protein